MTSMKKGKYYRYFDDIKGEFCVIKLRHKKYMPDGWIYGTRYKYKLYCDPVEGNVGLIYTTRYFWNKFSKEITKDEAMVHSI